MSFYSTIWLYVTEFSFHHIPPQYVVPLVVLEQSNNMMQYLIHSSVNEHIDLFFLAILYFCLVLQHQLNKNISSFSIEYSRTPKRAWPEIFRLATIFLQESNGLIPSEHVITFFNIE